MGQVDARWASARRKIHIAFQNASTSEVDSDLDEASHQVRAALRALHAAVDGVLAKNYPMDLSGCPPDIVASAIKTFRPLDAATLGNAQGRMVLSEGHDDGDFDLLLRLGVDVNGLDPSDGQTALTRAVSSVESDLNTITKLVQTEKADVNVSNHLNELPITLAMKKGLQGVAASEFLLGRSELKVDVTETMDRTTGATLLHNAATPKIARLVLSKGFPVDTISTGGRRPKNTALCHFTYFGRADLVDVCIEAGADINAVVVEGEIVGGMTPLIIAIFRRHPNLARKFINKGADLLIADRTGSTALHHATTKLDLDLFTEIANKAPELLTRLNSLNQSVLHTVTKVDGNPGKILDIVTHILNRMAAAASTMVPQEAGDETNTDVNPFARDNTGRTGLMNAVEKGYAVVAEKLLDRLSPERQRDELLHADHVGKTALSLAEEKGHRALLGQLRARLRARASV